MQRWLKRHRQVQTQRRRGQGIRCQVEEVDKRVWAVISGKQHIQLKQTGWQRTRRHKGKHTGGCAVGTCCSRGPLSS